MDLKDNIALLTLPGLYCDAQDAWWTGSLPAAHFKPRNSTLYNVTEYM